MSKKLKPRDKITQKMSRDGLDRGRNRRHRRAGQRARAGRGFFSSPNRRRRKPRSSFRTPPAARQLVPIPRAFPEAGRRRSRACFGAYRRCPYPRSIQKRRRVKHGRSGEVAAKTKTSRLQFTEEERATPELQKVDPQIGKSRRPLGRGKRGRLSPKKRKLDGSAPLTKPPQEGQNPPAL